VKKTLVTVAATAVLSSSFVAEAAASTYKVQSGDSLWSIALEHETSVTKLKSLNKLHSDLIFPNQVLKVGSFHADNAESVSKPQESVSHKPAKTYTIKSGDTLIGIANKHSITLAELKKWNNISGHLIYPGEKLVVAAGGESIKEETPSTPVPPPAPSGNSTYIVKSGDTLSHISIRTGLSVAEIKRLNGLKSYMIYVGQELKVGKNQAYVPEEPGNQVSDDEKDQSSFNASTLIANAKAQLGKPYVWGGSSTSGFDCSGFIYYAFNKTGLKLTRTSSEGYYNRSFYVNKPSIGDLVFFENTYKKGISHLGIYVGNNKFIHAGDNGVEITSLDNSYWKSKFDGFKRFYEL
jgi:peptidoglycan DL-endopeptidase LytE